MGSLSRKSVWGACASAQWWMFSYAVGAAKPWKVYVVMHQNPTLCWFLAITFEIQHSVSLHFTWNYDMWYVTWMIREWYVTWWYYSKAPSFKNFCPIPLNIAKISFWLKLRMHFIILFFQSGVGDAVSCGGKLFCWVIIYANFFKWGTSGKPE